MALKIKFTILVLISLMLLASQHMIFDDLFSGLSGGACGLCLAMAITKFAFRKILDALGDDDEPPKIDLRYSVGLSLAGTIGMIPRMDWATWISGFFLGTFFFVSMILAIFWQVVDKDDFFD